MQYLHKLKCSQSWMNNLRGQIPTIVIFLFFIFFSIFIGKLIVLKSPLLIFGLVAGLIIFLITLVKTDLALIILIFSMLLSPEIPIIQIPERSVVIRIDDILLIVVFFSWLAKIAINKQLGLLKRTPLNVPIVAYILICIFSTAIGRMTGQLSLIKSSFYILKYIEYFMLYFLVTNNLRDKKQIRVFIVVFLITCALTCTYALSTVGQLQRATAPFEGIKGEPNTLGGYLILLFAITAGLFLYSYSKIWRFCFVALLYIIFITLLFTLSRGSYLAFLPMYLTFIVLSKKKKFLLIGVLILSILILPAMMPTKVTQRIAKTFMRGRIYGVFGRRITLDAASSARVESWESILKKSKGSPLFGYGVTGVGFIDSQYPRILGETGMTGILIFIWLMATIFKYSFYNFNNIEDDWPRGLTLGFIAGFVGLLIHGLSASTFIIVRIMEPFWFLAAIVMVLPEVMGAENSALKNNQGLANGS